MFCMVLNILTQYPLRPFQALLIHQLIAYIYDPTTTKAVLGTNSPYFY